MHEICFITFQPAAIVIKLFYGRNVFVTGKSFQPSESWLTPAGFGLKYTRLERLAGDKHSNLLQKLVNCYRKKFITLGVL